MIAILRRAGRVVLPLAASVLFLLPLLSLFGPADVGALFKIIIVALTVGAAASPGAALVALVVLLPLALGLESLVSPALSSVAITESLVFAFVAGSAWRVAGRREGERDWLAAPALALGVLVAASCLVELAGRQTADPVHSMVITVWRHVTRQYATDARAFPELHEAYRWLADLALAAFAERVLRRFSAFRPMVVRMWLAGLAAGASFAALRLAEVLLTHRGHALAELIFILRRVRITVLYPDVNAAGSAFALSLVAATLLGVARRSVWVLAVVVPLLFVAFTLAQSRAAIAAVVLVLGVIWLVPVLRARRMARAAAAVAAVVIVLVGVSSAMRASHARASVALDIRTEMAQVALRIARDHPVFGVGVGQYLGTSRLYITPHLAALYRFAPYGENAHDNFLQVLAELGLPGLALFLWIVLPSAWPRRMAGGSGNDIVADAAFAIAAGLAAFLVSAILGHPLLIPEVAAAFFLALGTAAGLRAAPRARAWTDALGWIVAGVIVVTLPWRVAAALRPTESHVTGVGPVAGVIDGVPYRTAAAEATWRVAARAARVEIPVRWDAAGPRDCELDVLFEGQQADRVRPTAEAWLPVQFQLMPPPPGITTRAIELRIASGACRLLVGPIAVQMAPPPPPPKPTRRRRS